MILNIFFRAKFPPLLQSPINAGAFTMLAGLVIVPVVSVLTRAPDKAEVDKCFSCYEETVSVKVRDDLGN
jgi:Na+(H+)/acetate symporter ActP